MVLMHDIPFPNRETSLNLWRVVGRRIIAYVDVVGPFQQGKVCQLIDLLQVIDTLTLEPSTWEQMVSLQCLFLLLIVGSRRSETFL